MAEPLDYRNPRHVLGQPPGQSARKSPGPKPVPVLAVIPVGFSHLLLRSTDHAGIRAIEAALQAVKIPFFRTQSTERVKRTIELHIRPADLAPAMKLADEIVRRRSKINSFPKQKLNPDPGWPDPDRDRVL